MPLIGVGIRILTSSLHVERVLTNQFNAPLGLLSTIPWHDDVALTVDQRLVWPVLTLVVSGHASSDVKICSSVDSSLSDSVVMPADLSSSADP